MIAVRRLTLDDLGAALAIQAAAYPAFLRESTAAFASRLTLPASYCLAAEEGGVLLGYLLAHAWPRHSPPPIGAVLTAGGGGDVLYIHDLSISPAVQGRGLGRTLIEEAFSLARADGLRRAELIAVEGRRALLAILELRRGGHVSAPCREGRLVRRRRAMDGPPAGRRIAKKRRRMSPAPLAFPVARKPYCGLAISTA